MNNLGLSNKTSQKTTVNQIKYKKRNRTTQRFLDNAELLLLTIPALIYFIMFHYWPMFGVVLAFKDFKYIDGIFGSKWIGFKNFEFFFTSQDAWRITRNTVGYNIAFIVLGISCAIIIALLLFEIGNKLAIKFYQTSMLLPHFMSWVIVSYISYILLSPTEGVLNQIFKVFNLEPIQWYADPKYWPPILIIFNLWKGIGMSCIIYYAALMGIDSSLFEAAKIDGANKLQQIWNISIPSLIPMMIILMILSIGNMFRGDFGLFYSLPRDVGVLYPTTDVIDTYVYRGLQSGFFGISSAVGLFQSIVGFVLIIASNAIVKRVQPENTLF